MNTYPEYKSINYPEVGERVLHYWKHNRLFEHSISARSGSPTYTFYEGPPSANGTPGIHHVMARTIKDIFCRYKTMAGFQVHRKGGWDTHGLPVELQVEKEISQELGVTFSKEDIGVKISVEEYNERCRQTVMRYKAEWDDLTQKMGYWVDLNDPYITFENSYIESCWYLIKELYRKNLLYKGYTIQPYSPAAGTGLSSHELNQPGCYKMVKDTSIVAQFKVKRNEKSEKLFLNLGSGAKPFSHRELLRSINDPEITATVSGVTWTEVYLLAWTTTPWTLSSNSALAVGPKIVYTKVMTYNPYTYKPIVVLLAKDLLNKYFHPKSAEISLESYNPGDKVIPYRVMEEYAGEALIGLEYEQLMPYVTPSEPAFRVISGDFVTTEAGTGIVHIAPTFGADDARVAKLAGIPSITVSDNQGKPMPLVDKQGKFVSQMGEFAGLYVKNYEGNDESDPGYKSTDVLISIKLKTENKAFKVEKYEHSYPHCWRTDKPVLYYPLESWFIRTTALKDRMVELNATIAWKPESTGTGRFGNWLENLVDWNLSRSRYWGTPLPIWVSEDGAETKCIGSITELKEEIRLAKQAGISTLDPFEKENALDLHRPYVDQIVLVDSRGKSMYRQPDLIDVWFDSGAMPYAQWNYPFAKSSLEGVFPADFISEGVDQTRGWFFTLHALSVMLFDSVAFKNVLSTGLVLDKNGEKMSKRKGNVINPFQTLDTYGPDTTRWYMVSNSNPWDNLKFDLEGVAEVQRKFFGTLHNTYNFYALYANLDSYLPEQDYIQTSAYTEADKWVLSRLHTLVEEVTQQYDAYEPTRVARALTDFVCDDLSNWYVRLNRKRFWLAQLNEDKKAAFHTLHTCLKTVVQLAAPIAPFYMEELYLNLTCGGITKAQYKDSVHLSLFPTVDKSLINKELEQKMSLAQQITSLVHSLRKNNNLRVRLPLNKILIPILEPETKNRILAVQELILTEVNVKSIEFIEDTTGVVTKKVKPNFQTLGKTYGKVLKDIGARIAELHQHEITLIEKGQPLEIEVNDTLVILNKEDLLITTEDIPGWKVAGNDLITVALDVTLTDALRSEGIARDFVNRVQNIRKDLQFEVMDKIEIRVQSHSPFVDQALQEHKSYICNETQATFFDLQVAPLFAPDTKTLEMEDFELKVWVSKAV